MSEAGDEGEAEDYTFQYFSPHQKAVVTAVANRIMPGSDDTPSAEESGVIRYIDQILVREPEYRTEYDDRLFQSAYNDGIRRLERTAQELYGASVPELEPSQLDELLEEIEDGEVPEWEDIPRYPLSMTVSEDDFFTILRDHVVEGYYAWPKHGSNKNLDSWRAVGYTGPFLEGYQTEDLKPPWKSFGEIEDDDRKTRPEHFHGGDKNQTWDPSEGYKND